MECVQKAILTDARRPMPYSAGLVLLIGGHSGKFVNTSDCNRKFLAVMIEIIGLISLPFILLELVFRLVLAPFIIAGEAIVHLTDQTMDAFHERLPTFGKHLGEITRRGLEAGFVSMFVFCD